MPEVDPFRIQTGKWYSTELKRRAVAEQIAERDAALPKHVCSTPPSLPWPSNEAEEATLLEVREKIALMRPQEFANDIQPYWNTLSYYKDMSTIQSHSSRLHIKAPPGSISLPSFSSLQRLTGATTTPESDDNSLSTLYLMLETAEEIAEAQKKGETIKTKLPREGALISDPDKVPLALNALQKLSETSQEALKVILPALVEADVYYAAETLTQVLRTSGVLPLAETLTSSLNPNQITSLLPAMCRVNPTWREDGFFDLTVEVLSTGGILRWEPSDVAKVLSALPKVPIADDYYTIPDFDPALPSNANKSHQELLNVAQDLAKNSAEARWDHFSYGLPGDFLLAPSTEDVEAAKREYEQAIQESNEFTETSQPDTVNYSSSSASTANPDSASQAPQSSSFQSSTKSTSEDDDLLSYLDVSNNEVQEFAPEGGRTYAPVYYNPIAWQPEELGRLVGTMLSQELELDDIVNVLSSLGAEGWADSADTTPWFAYMGYLSTVISDALTANKHWVDEDYTWVLHDVITKVGPWALRQWPEYRAEEHQKWLVDLIAQTAIKYGRFKHDYRFIQVALNMLCDAWPEYEHQKLADMIEARMKDRTYVGRAQNWYKWRVQGTFKEHFSDQRAAQSSLWIAPYNVGDNPKLPDLVEAQDLREKTSAERFVKNLTQQEDERLSPPSRTGTKANNTVNW